MKKRSYKSNLKRRGVSFSKSAAKQHKKNRRSSTHVRGGYRL